MAELWLPAICTRQFNFSYFSSPVGKSLTFRNISVPRCSIPFQCFSLLVQKYRRLSSIFSWQQRQQMTAYITRWQSSMASVCSFSFLARKFTPQILRSSRYTINSHHFRKGSPIANTFQRAFSLQRWEIKLFTAFRTDAYFYARKLSTYLCKSSGKLDISSIQKTPRAYK